MYGRYLQFRLLKWPLNEGAKSESFGAGAVYEARCSSPICHGTAKCVRDRKMTCFFYISIAAASRVRLVLWNLETSQESIRCSKLARRRAVPIIEAESDVPSGNFS